MISRRRDARRGLRWSEWLMLGIAIGLTMMAAFWGVSHWLS